MKNIKHIIYDEAVYILKSKGYSQSDIIKMDFRQVIKKAKDIK